MKKFWKAIFAKIFSKAVGWWIRCFVAWTFTVVGSVLAIFMLLSYFLKELRPDSLRFLDFLGFLDPLYVATPVQFVAISFATLCLSRVIGGVITKTGILPEKGILSLPRFRDGVT